MAKAFTVTSIRYACDGGCGKWLDLKHMQYSHYVRRKYHYYSYLDLLFCDKCYKRLQRS